MAGSFHDHLDSSAVMMHRPPRLPQRGQRGRRAALAWCTSCHGNAGSRIGHLATRTVSYGPILPLLTDRTRAATQSCAAPGRWHGSIRAMPRLPHRYRTVLRDGGAEVSAS